MKAPTESLLKVICNVASSHRPADNSADSHLQLLKERAICRL